MAGVINKIGLWGARLAAMLVMLLAVLLGIARLLLPEASRFADDVRVAASEASGFEVDFELLSAGVSLYGPELRLTTAEVNWPDGMQAFAAQEIAIAIDLYRLATTGELMPSMVHIEGLQLDVEIDAGGEVLLQGRPWSDYVGNAKEPLTVTHLRISLEDIQFGFHDKKRGIDSVDANLRSLVAVLDEDEIELEADIRPDPEFGRRLEVDGLLPVQLLRDPAQLAADRAWRLQMRAEDFRLDPWLKLTAIAQTPLISSEGTAEAAVEFVGRQPVSVRTAIDIDELVLAQPDGEFVVYDELAGTADWLRGDDGWDVSGSDIRLARNDRRWPSSEFVLSYQAPNKQSERLAGSVSFVRLEDLMPMLTAFGSQLLQDAGVQGSASGDLWSAVGELELRNRKIFDYEVEAGFETLGYQSPAQGVEVVGLSGQVKADSFGGRLSLASQDARLRWDYLFREVLPVSSLEGLAVWRLVDDSFRLIVSDLHVETPDGRGSASFELHGDNELKNPQIDLSAEASMPDATKAARYLPNTLPEPVLNWVDQAVVAGRSDNTRFTLRGPLREFPFREDQGSFYIDIEFADAGLAYAPGWPAVEQASGHLIFDNESMYSIKNQLTVGDVALSNVNASIDDLRGAVVTIDTEGETDAGRLVSFLQNSPVAEKLGRVFADVGASGRTDASIRLQIPVSDPASWDLRGEVDLHDVSAWLNGLEPRLTEIKGALRVDRLYVSAEQMTGRLMDEAVSMRIEPNTAADANFSHRASLTGSFPYSRIRQELGLPDLGVIDGRTTVKAAAMFPAFRSDSDPFRLLLHSDLEGISSSLPYPVNKAADSKELFDAEILFPAASLVQPRLHLERGLRAHLDFGKTAGRWGLNGGLVFLGDAAETTPGEDGLAISAAIDRLSLDEWIDAFAAGGLEDASIVDSPGRSQWQDMFASAELLVGNLEIMGFGFEDTDVRVDFGGSEWDVELIGPWLEGRVTVPYELDSDATVVAELSRLLMIEPLESGETEGEEYSTSPANLPSFRGLVNEFALGTMRLGKLDFDVRSTGDGLQTQQFDLSAPSFRAEISGDWQVVDNVQRSRLHLEFNSSDLENSLAQLGFAPLISAPRASLVSDLLWEGGPSMAALEASTGEVSMVIRDGHINDVSAGGGRLLGLLSVASLPRRLALDFTDLTKNQLEFDKISGDFNIDFGDAWTCNLGLEGEVADMALVGRTGLNEQDYNQVAVVRPHVSNLMPVPAAFLGGPTVGVAALLVSQIFKKPLSGIGESYYTIRGPWEGSDIQRVQRSQLDTTPFANCEQQLPTLSPEELAAIEDLISQQQTAETTPSDSPLQETPPTPGSDAAPIVNEQQAEN